MYHMVSNHSLNLHEIYSYVTIIKQMVLVMNTDQVCTLQQMLQTDTKLRIMSKSRKSFHSVATLEIPHDHCNFSH